MKPIHIILTISLILANFVCAFSQQSDDNRKFKDVKLYNEKNQSYYIKFYIKDLKNQTSINDLIKTFSEKNEISKIHINLNKKATANIIYVVTVITTNTNPEFFEEVLHSNGFIIRAKSFEYDSMIELEQATLKEDDVLTK